MESAPHAVRSTAAPAAIIHRAAREIVLCIFPVSLVRLTPRLHSRQIARVCELSRIQELRATSGNRTRGSNAGLTGRAPVTRTAALRARDLRADIVRP